MDLASLDIIKIFSKKCGIHPSKRMGQNFLISREVLEKIIETADLKKDDVVLEIGPGFGALTEELAKRVGRVVAVEFDRKLAGALRENIKNYKNVEVVEEDILKFQVSSFKLQEYGYKIVANLPYQITSAMLRKFLENEPRPSGMVVMVQKEVAERICAGAGKTSLLSLSVQFYGRPKIVEVVPRSVFWPEPEVDSAILKIFDIKKTTEENVKKIDHKKFFSLAKIGFSAKRKQLQNNLAGGKRIPNDEAKKFLSDMGFDSKVRAGDLDLGDWIKLAKNAEFIGRNGC